MANDTGQQNKRLSSADVELLLGKGRNKLPKW